MFITILAIVAIVLYLAAAVLLAAPLTGCPLRHRRLGLGIGTVAMLAHAGILFGVHGGRVDLHFFAALSLVAFGVAAMTLLVNLRKAVAGLGVIVFPLAAVLLALDAFIAPPTTPHPLDWQISLHVAIALLAYSVLSISAALAILLALQERALRSHRPARLVRALPPLTQTETLLFRLIGTGFVLLTLTLLTGALFVHNMLGQHLAHIIVFSVIAWVVFCVLLLGRWRYGWRGPRAVNLTLIGMLLLAMGFFGSKFVLEVLLQRAL